MVSFSILSAFGRRAPLDVHCVVVLEEDDADLRQPPTGKFFNLWRDIGSQGDRADEEPVLPHRLTGWTRDGPGFSLAAFGGSLRCDCVSRLSRSVRGCETPVCLPVLQRQANLLVSYSSLGNYCIVHCR